VKTYGFITDENNVIDIDAKTPSEAYEMASIIAKITGKNLTKKYVRYNQYGTARTIRTLD